MQNKTLNGESLSITEEKLARLRELLPEAFSEGKVDWEKLRIVLREEGEFSDERYHLNWAGKTDAFRSLQAPTTATLAPCPEESVDFDGSDNVFIEGENLEALKILQKSYFGKVKMIYIDPPYNTGNDHFIYPDRFAESKDAYLKRTGDRDEQGFMTRAGLFRKNNRENGHFHSSWLSMIYPRLFLARNLLREDGVIFVSIDDNEAHNLRMAMNEIFGEDNFRNEISVRRYDKNISRQFIDKGMKSLAVGYERILAYAKSDKTLFNPIYRPAKKERQKKGYWKGFWNAADRPTMRYNLLGVQPIKGQWKWKESEAIKAVKNYQEYQSNSDNVSLETYWRKTGKTKNFIRRREELTKGKNKGVEHWVAPSEGVLLSSNWEDVLASENLDNIGISFDSPKRVELIKRLVMMDTENDSVILDFFAGSCTTAHAVMQLNAEDGGNRRFICVQMPEPCDKKHEAFKAGYKTIADIGKERIRRAIKNGDLDVGFKVFKLQDSNFKIWRGTEIRDEKELEKQLKMHTASIVSDAKTENIIYELLLKSGFPLTAPIEDRDGWFMAQDGEATLALALERIDKPVIKTILAAAPQKFITLDHLFENNDQLKTNTALQMEDAGIAFDVV